MRLAGIISAYRFPNVYIKMQENREVWNYYSEKYKINYVFWSYHNITPWSQIFIKRISDDPKWPLIYKDGEIAIFIKNIPENRNIISRYLGK